MSDRHNQTGDEYARQSFTFRGMKTWQLWGITAVSAVVIIALLVYALA
jgi:hypothetical protein